MAEGPEEPAIHCSYQTAITRVVAVFKLRANRVLLRPVLLMLGNARILRVERLYGLDHSLYVSLLIANYFLLVSHLPSELVL